MEAHVSGSIVKPSREAKRTALIMRTGSSRNRMSGFPMERMTRRSRSARPPTWSITLKVEMS